MKEVEKHYTDSIYYDLEQAAKICRTLANQLFENLDLNLSAEEHIVLDTILCNAGICQRDLAKLILRDRANTGRLLNSLEAKGLITRFVDMKNNRLVRKMAVTEKGHKLWKAVSEKTRPIFERCSEMIPEGEIENLRIALRKFRERASEFIVETI